MGLSQKAESLSLTTTYPKIRVIHCMYVLYDNSDLDKYIKNFDNKFIDTKRIYHLFLNFFLDKQTLEKINSYDYIIHFGNFGFKTTIKSYTLIQNILPLAKPFSSLRNFALSFAYKYSFIISDEIILNFLKKSPAAGYASEEQEGYIDFKNNNDFIVFADPLDGSSNIEM